jgi:hypothetical protein
VTGEQQKSSANSASRAKLNTSRKAIAPPVLSEAERKLKMAERSALLMQLKALDEYLGTTRRCRSCGEDVFKD